MRVAPAMLARKIFFICAPNYAGLGTQSLWRLAINLDALLS